MTFLERWANSEPSKPPGVPEAADSEPIEAGSGGIPPADSPELADPTPKECVNDIDTPAPSLKGSAVELWRDGRRFFLVSDEQDALEAMRRFGAGRGEIWTGAEIELVCAIPDQATRDEVESLKRQMDGSLAPDAAGEGVSAAEWQAQMLNELFREQGKAGVPGRITAKTVEHGLKRKLR
jgi:hypothetical protein